MSRQLKRVPLDFAWPLEKVWEGYLNPHYRECGACDGRGATAASKRLREIVSLLMISGEDSLRGRNHPYFTGANFDGRVVPSPDMAELSGGLAGRPPRDPFGHDSIDAWEAQKKIVAAAGLPETWGTCPVCGGDGIDPAARDAYEAWQKTEPPTGEGYQLWETVSEGSPVSPVFADVEAFVRYLRSEGHSEASARRFVTTGWAPSGVMVGGTFAANIDALDLLPPGDGD